MSESNCVNEARRASLEDETHLLNLYPVHCKVHHRSTHLHLQSFAKLTFSDLNKFIYSVVNLILFFPSKLFQYPEAEN